MKSAVKIILCTVLFALIVPEFDLFAQIGKGASGNSFSSSSHSSSTQGKSGTNLKKGFKGIAEVSMGGCTYKHDYIYSPIDAGVAISLGYQFNPYIYLGGVIGMGMLNIFIAGVDFRAYFTKTKIAPFLGMQTGLGFGYSFLPWGYDVYGCADYSGGGYGHYDPGFYFGAGPGVRFAIGKRFGIALQPAIKLVYGEVPENFSYLVNISFDF